MIVRFRAKVLDLLGGGAATLTQAPPTDDDWYLNLLLRQLRHLAELERGLARNREL